MDACVFREILHEKPFCLILMAKWTVIKAGVVIFDGIGRQHSTLWLVTNFIAPRLFLSVSHRKDVWWPLKTLSSSSSLLVFYTIQVNQSIPVICVNMITNTVGNTNIFVNVIESWPLCSIFSDSDFGIFILSCFVSQVEVHRIFGKTQMNETCFRFIVYVYFE